MRYKIIIKPGGETEIRVLGDDLTEEEGAKGILRLLRILSEKGRIPFARVAAIESHRGHTAVEAVSHRQSVREGE